MCYHYTSRLNLEHISSLVFHRDNMKRSENEVLMVHVLLIGGTISLLRLHMLNKSLSQVILMNLGSLVMTFLPDA